MQGQAFSEFFHAVYPALRTYVARRVPVGEVEDVLQETFSSLWDGDHPDPVTPADHQRLRALVFRIADHRAADMYRTRSRSERRMEAVTRELRVATGPSALDELLDRTPPAWLHELSVDALDVLLRYVEGVPVHEIADELGITPNAVSSRLRRIRERVPQLVDDLSEDLA